MTNSHTDIHTATKSPNMTTGLNMQGERVPHWDMHTLLGAGGVSSTVDDLAKFAKAHFTDDKALALSRHPTTKEQEIALAWFTQSDNDDKIWLWHNGGTGGYSGYITINPDDKKAVIILSNISGESVHSQFIDKLGNEIITLLK